jgi:hypothetical protein
MIDVTRSWSIGMSNHSKLYGTALALALLSGCSSSLQPVTPTTRVGERPAKDVVLALRAPCDAPSNRTPLGRPDGEHGHTLPPGNYVPSFADARGVYFQSPSGVAVTEPEPVGTRSRAGGIYVPNDQDLIASAYLGDEDRVIERSPLPGRCNYSIEPRESGAVQN